MTRLPALMLLALFGSTSSASAAPTERPQIRLEAPDGSPLADLPAHVSCGDGIEYVFVADANGRIPAPAQLYERTCWIRVQTESEELLAAIEADAARVSELVLQKPYDPTAEDSAQGSVITFEEFRNIPVGSSTSRDFTAVIESSATVSRDSAGISLAGTTSAESTFAVEDQGPVAGTLTAGAVDDVISARSYFEFLGTIEHPNAARFKAVRRHIVRVVDSAGEPIAGAHVDVGDRSFRSRRDGRVVLVPGWDGIDGSEDIEVRSGSNRRVVSFESLRRGQEQEIALDPERVQAPAAKLDLVLVLDTTGSMGDELEYLKVEMDALLARLDHKHASLEIRWGLIVYRDEGDEYVARVHEFTDDFATFRASLKRQSASGGGDAPEAVHSAFAAAQQLRWRDASSASRVLLHLADAPAHREHTLEALRSADRLRTQGTAIYPIAASGVDEDAEFTMRSMAMFSGGQYVFLTDDSGIGNSHREASSACFKVEPLIDVMGAILEAEVAGVRPVLPQGDRGSACPGAPRGPLASGPPAGPPRTPRHPLERSLMDDDALTDFLHQPRTRHMLP